MHGKVFKVFKFCNVFGFGNNNHSDACYNSGLLPFIGVAYRSKIRSYTLYKSIYKSKIRSYSLYKSTDIYNPTHNSDSKISDKSLLLLTSPIQFIVRYNDVFYTNVLFTNEMRFIMYKLRVGYYKFSFSMSNLRGIYIQVFDIDVHVGVLTKRDALDISCKLAKAIYGRLCIDKTQPVKVTLKRLSYGIKHNSNNEQEYR